MIDADPARADTGPVEPPTRSDSAAGPVVLHVAQPTDGGVGRYIAQVARDQRARGWQVVVACPDGRLAATLRADGVRWLSWPASRSPGWRTVGETVRLRRLVRRIRPTVLHLHSAKAGLAGRLAVRGAVRTLHQPHAWSWLAARGVLVPIVVAWERFATRWTDLAICVGEDDAAMGRDRGVTGPLAVVRNGVDLDEFVPGRTTRAESRNWLGLDPDVPLAVCVGRVTRQKGQDRLLAAWPVVRAQCPRAALCIVGDGDLPIPPTSAELPEVRFLPAAADPRLWYAAADVVVLPSRWEGASLTLLEALAMGRSVVATDIPGLREPLRGLADALVPAGDLSALATAIAKRLNDVEFRRAEESTARRRVLDFNLRRTLDRLAAVTVGAGSVGARR